jgi:hypothetical protein
LLQEIGLNGGKLPPNFRPFDMDKVVSDFWPDADTSVRFIE